MSGGYECALGDSTHDVQSLFTSLRTGQTLAVCDDCMPIALVGQLAGLLGVDMDALYANIERFVDREAKKAAKAVEAAAKQDAEAGLTGEQATAAVADSIATGRPLTVVGDPSENTDQEAAE